MPTPFRPRARSIHTACAIAVAMAPALLACSTLIGTRDLVFDADGGPAEDGGGDTDASRHDATAAHDSEASLDDGGPEASIDAGGAEASIDAGGTDGATCHADLQGDPKNCGRCGHDCLGGACTTGVCQPLAIVSTGSPRWVRVDATNIYYTDSSLESVRKIPKAGGAPSVVCNSLGTGTETLQIDATKAYFSFDTPSDGGTLGAIAQCPLSGGPATILASGQYRPRDLLIDGSTLFWVELGINGAASTVKRMASAGGAVTSVTHGIVGSDISLGIGGGSLFVANDTANGTLVRCPLAGACSAPQTIAANPNGIDAVALDGQNLYWGLGVIPGSIYVGLPDGGGATIVTAAAEVPHTFVFDARYLYWLNTGPRTASTGDYDQGSLMRCPHAGAGAVVDCGATGPERMAGPYLYVHGLVSDTDALYWVESGVIWRLAK